MGQVPKLVYHTAALKVDDHKGHLVGVIQKCHRKDITLKDLTFSGACGSSYQAMRAMCFLMKIQVNRFLLGIDTKGRCQSLVNLRRTPVYRQVHILWSVNMKQLKKGDIFHQAAFQIDFLLIHRCQLVYRFFHFPVCQGVDGKLLLACAVFHINFAAGVIVLEHHHFFTAIWQHFLKFPEKQEGNPFFFCPVHHLEQRMLLDFPVVIYKYQ